MAEEFFTWLQREKRLELSAQQRQAVETTEGAVLLTATPGSGKTTVIVCRTAYLLREKKIPAGQILTLTFGKQSQLDMDRRFAALFPEMEKPRFSTLHALSLSILRRYCEITGGAMFSLLPDSAPVVRELLRKQILILERIVMLCKRHCTGIEPAVDDFRHTFHGLAAVRTRDVVLSDVFFEFFVAPTVHDDLRHAVCRVKILDQLIRAESGLARLAVYQRVRESAHVTGCHPGLRVHQNRRVEADIVLGLLHEFSPPGVLDVLFQFRAQWTVIPCIGQTAVNLGTRIDKPSVLREGNDFFHCNFSVYIAHVF